MVKAKQEKIGVRGCGSRTHELGLTDLIATVGLYFFIGFFASCCHIHTLYIAVKGMVTTSNCGNTICRTTAVHIRSPGSFQFPLIGGKLGLPGI